MVADGQVSCGQVAKRNHPEVKEENSMCKDPEKGKRAHKGVWGTVWLGPCAKEQIAGG